MASRFRNALIVVLQVGFMTLISMAANALSSHFGWRVPGNVVGLLILFLLLQTKVIRMEWVESGANWLLAELLLFFIPSVVGILQYKQVVATAGFRILFVIGVSTLLVMASTGLAAKHLAKNVGDRVQDGNVAEHR